MSIHECRSGSRAWERTRVRVPVDAPALRAHLHAPSQEAAEVLLGGQVEDGQAAGLGDAAGARRVDDDAEAADLGREGCRRAQDVGERRSGRRRRRTRGWCRGPAAGLAPATRPGRGRRSRRGTRRRARGGRPIRWRRGSRRRRRRRTRRARLARRSRPPPPSPSRSPPGRPTAERGRRRRSWRGCGGCRGTGARAGRLAGGGHHLGRRAPVDVAQVVAGDVLAQRVEGQVALADRVGRDALEVAQQARRRATPSAPGADAPAPRGRASTPRRARRGRSGRPAGSWRGPPGSRRGARCGS